MTTRPDISIVTPVFNRAHLIGEAIESVRQQEGVVAEHIIVDGGSTDGTLDVLAGYPHIRVLTGPDRGMYDAMNKGIAAARADVIGHLNSDDLYRPGALGAAVRALRSDPAADSAAGGIEYFTVDEHGTQHVTYTDDLVAVKQLRLTDVTRDMPHINTRFFRTRVYERVGRFDPTFRVSGDREFLLRACLAGIRTVPIDRIVYGFRDHADSLTHGVMLQEPWPFFDEQMQVVRRHLANPSLPSVAREELRRWRAREYGLAVVQHLAARRWGDAAGFAVRGAREDPTWPLRFVAQATLNRIYPRRSRRGCPCDTFTTTSAA